jgi:NDP-sugar pyrophosphorylase family protein
MEFAIIAAGEGSRLRQEGFKFAKPMVVLQDLTLISRLINIFSKNNASNIHIVINEYSPELRHHLNDIETEVKLNVIVKTTPSSLHSFYEILPYIKEDKVCLTTVDTVFDEAEFGEYIKQFHDGNGIDGLMAATSFVDDESPLYVSTDEALNIRGFFDIKQDDSDLISGGVYCFKSTVYPIVTMAVENGSSRMRNFQRMLVSEGLLLKAYPFSKIIDIDHLSDIDKAEAFLSEKAMAVKMQN